GVAAKVIHAHATRDRLLQSRRLNMGENPIPDIVDAELAVVDLAMLGPTLRASENLDVLALRANPFVKRLRLLRGHDAVVLTVHDQERAFDLFRYTLEREPLCPFERGRVVRRAQDPAELKVR